MRMSTLRMLIPVLALVAVACAPHHHHPWVHDGMGMPHGCGPEACSYRSKCFSSGAIRSNDGVCQACTGGKWVAATGCSECGCHHHDCGGGGKMPCDHDHHDAHHPKPAR